MARTFVACVLPTLAVSVAWLRIEDPRRVGEAAAGVVVLALAPALIPKKWLRLVVTAGGVLAVGWIAFAMQPWELLPFRDERVLAPATDATVRGIGDFYGVVLPFDPESHLEMHALLLVAVYVFVSAIALLVAAQRPLSAAAVTVAGAGWPATLLGEGAVMIGALALAGALSIPLILRVRSGPSLVAGAATAALVVTGAAWASSASTFARDATLDWQAWDFRGAPARALGVQFVWDANYDGVSFPPTETVVLKIAGPELAQYWRASTLDLFTADRWLEDLSLIVLGEASRSILPGVLTPGQAQDKAHWLEQRVDVQALVDDRVVAAGTPVAIDAPSLGTVFFLSGGVVRARQEIDSGTRYRVWSYVPDPSPAALAAAPARYPPAARRFLEVWGRSLPPFDDPSRDKRLRALLGDPAYAAFAAYRPLYEAARRVTGREDSPYAAVLALESWFRQRGGFRYEEKPPRAIDVPPLVQFVTESRAGYCQHFAGAMTVMLRLLGIPARVAVGFTSGRYEDGIWTVTDHNAHAWVEVWFPSHGWVPFDPTPGRGTFAGTYSFASESAAAVAALGRGELGRLGAENGRSDAGGRGTSAVGRPRGSDSPSLVGLALLLTGLGAAVVGLTKAFVRRTRYLTRDPRRTAAASRKELEAFLRDQGIPISRSATLDALRRAVENELGLNASAFAEAAGRGRFGRPDQADRDAHTARRELRALLRRVRRELSVWARLRGFVSLRSLRGGWQA